MPLDLGITALDAVSAPTVGVRIQKSDLAVAPYSVSFEAWQFSGWDTPAPSGTRFDARRRDLIFTWDFGDGTTNRRFVTGKNLPEAWRDATKGYGPEVAHVYETAGSWTPSLTVEEPSSGKSVTITFDPIVVVSAETHFAPTGPAETFWVGAPGACPVAGAIDKASFAAAWADMRADDGQTDIRIMLEDGWTEDIGSGVSGASASTSFRFRTIYIDTEPGAETMPEITVSGENGSIIREMNKMMRPTAEGTVAFVARGIHFRGLWDAVRMEGVQALGFEFGRGAEEVPASGFTRNGPCEYWCLSGCRVSNFKICVSPVTRNPNPAANTILGVLHETEVWDWREYGIFGGGAGVRSDVGTRQFFAILGSDIAQNPNAGSGWVKDGKSNDHGPWRGGAATCYVAGSSFYSGSGHPTLASLTVGTDGWTGGRTWVTGLYQPAIRWAIPDPLLWSEGDIEDEVDPRLNMERFYVEGQLGFGTQNGVTPIAEGNILCADGIIVAGPHTGEIFTWRQGGISARNLSLVHPDIQRYSDFTDITRFIGMTSAASDPANIYGTMRHCAFVNQCTDAKTFGGSALVPVSQVVENTGGGITVAMAHNLLHEPGPSGGDTQFAPFTEVHTVTPYNAGVQPVAERYTGTLAATVGGAGGTFTIPYSEGDASYFRDNTRAHCLQLIGVADGSSNAEYYAGGVYGTNAGETTWTFGATGVTITNNSGVDWPAGTAWVAYLMRHPDHYPPKVVSAATPSPLAVILRPGSTSTAKAAATGSVLPVDMLGDARPASPTLGPVEAA
ncbi:hypothetical protein SAMN05444722_1676 [Rhodovulum sp. ES.010]|uniref:hypothetical protein n=1 Tax=Rhodovulum sp. ES.010 TaxID=1882821 RepID=UPI000926E58A|nr:hypothetical protein [Rhodovulum sp. ES.010]SIO36264.1 hypothetical protein SAMN05444722_1676 [Rhodovulum sp. ES.010]